MTATQKTVDGIISLATASLYEPYIFDPMARFRPGSTDNWRGFEYFGSSDNLNSVSQELVDAGFQLHFHVAGDAAVGLALSAIRGLDSNATGPHRVTHCFLIGENDRSSFQELGVIVDFQLAPSSVNRDYERAMAEFLGTDRAATLLPAVETHEAGATLVLSSDWDADTLSPLVKLQTALTRPTGRAFGNLTTLIPMMTLNAARLLHQADKTGSITVGKYADLVVLDKNIFNLPFDEIASTKATKTYLQGKVVFGN